MCDRYLAAEAFIGLRLVAHKAVLLGFIGWSGFAVNLHAAHAANGITLA